MAAARIALCAPRGDAERLEVALRFASMAAGGTVLRALLLAESVTLLQDQQAAGSSQARGATSNRQHHS